MQAHIYAKGDFGLPTTTLVRDLSGIATDISFTHASLWGCLTASVRWRGTLDDAFTAADQWLGNEIKIYDQDGNWCWEGLVWSVRFNAGRRGRVRSLEGYANRATVHYRSMDFTVSPPVDLGDAVPTQVEDFAEQKTYGLIEYQRNEGGVTPATAANIADRTLAERKRLLWVPESGTLGSSSGDAAEIELECYGWYRTLWYIPFTASSASTVDTATIVADVLDGWGLFISTDTSQIETTGVDHGRNFDTSEYPGEVIKRLVDATPGYTFGIGENRIPYLRPHNREQTAADYHEDLFGLVTSATGADVRLWDVRPDSVLRQLDFVPASANVSSEAIASVESVYLVETTYHASDNTLTYSSAVAGERGEVDT